VGCEGFLIQPSKTFSGDIQIPGDKSISHRAIILGAIQDTPVQIINFLQSDDCLATIRAFEQMGVRFEFGEDNNLIIHGVGLYGLKKPKEILNLGNSGTSIRLLVGFLSGQKFDSILTGDESLRKRPMQRVIEPLELMGAKIESNRGRAPLYIYGNQKLKAIKYLIILFWLG